MDKLLLLPQVSLCLCSGFAGFAQLESCLLRWKMQNTIIIIFEEKKFNKVLTTK